MSNDTTGDENLATSSPAGADQVEHSVDDGASEQVAACDNGRLRRRSKKSGKPEQETPATDSLSDEIRSILTARNALFEQHPVVRWDKYFAIPTPEIIRISSVVAHSVLRARSGRAIAGASRHGKSRLIVYFTRCIRAEPRFKRVSVFCMDASHSTRASELDFYADVLSATGYRLVKVRPAKERRNQCINHLVEIAAAAGDRRIVLFVDEAQLWTFNEWTWLKEIDMGLSHENVALVVIPVGQPELRHVRTVLRQANRRDLTTRFLRRIFEFGGFRTEDQLKQLFSAFDILTYPEDLGWTYAQFFFPRAWAAGWRLAQEAGTAWSELCKAIPAVDQPDFGMETAGFVIQHFLTEFTQDDSAGFTGSAEQWAEAVDAADLAEIDGLDTQIEHDDQGDDDEH